jgi:lipoprotein-anchoring transpeptidase ErfK/SrfK
MRAVIGGRGIALVATGLTASAMAALPAVAGAGAPDATSQPQEQSSELLPTTTTTSATAAKPAAAPAKRAARPAKLSVRLRGAHHGKIRVGTRVHAIGHIHPFVAGQHVRVKLLRKGHVVNNLNPEVKRVGHKHIGSFGITSDRLVKPGHYRAVATHDWTPQQKKATARSKKFGINYPDLDPGDRNTAVKTFNRLLARAGYYTESGKHYGPKTSYAVMAFSKVNKLSRTFNASPGMFKALANGKGSFHLKYPHAGKHVEVDISRQVMVLANHGRAQYTFHVSTGAPATPTIRGHYQFYSRDAGYNSEGMYYSVYWHGGYAIHGYASVPAYPASHGCVRNEIRDAIFAYNWVSIGMSIYTYG